jgi:hypothetical protein
VGCDSVFIGSSSGVATDEIPTFRHLEHQLEHSEDRGGDRHVVDIELQSVPSRRLEIMCSAWVAAFSVLLQSLLGGCSGWHHEARVEGVERVELAHKSERHVGSYAISLWVHGPAA